MGDPETSIVIRTFNEQRHLPNLLEAIRAQDYLDHEVIVVDSGSYDNTREIAMEHGAELLRIDSRDFTFGYSLNVGIRNSRGRYIAVVSAHTKPLSSSWLSSLIEPLRDERVAMSYGRQLGAPTSKYADTQDFKRTYSAKPKIPQRTSFFANNANSAIRRDLWENHQFDETLPGLEDMEWAKHWMEQGYLVVYSPDAALYHIHSETWGQVRRRYYREALAAKQIGIKGRGDIPIEVLREGSRLIKDLIAAGMEREREKSREIVQYRYHKAMGTIKGLWDGAVIEDPRQREAIYFDTTYKAVVIRGPGRAKLEDVDVPKVKPGDVLIKVAYVGVCPTDLEAYQSGQRHRETESPVYPITPGHEFSGRVVKLGPNVKHLREGDPVVAERIHPCGSCDHCLREDWRSCGQLTVVGTVGRDGAYAEYIVLPGAFVHRLPQSLGLREAALCEPLAAALKGLNRLERTFEPGKKMSCGVVGVGPIGHLAALILASKAHEVTVFDRSPVRRDYVKSVSGAISTSEDLGKLAQCDALIEATGDPETLNEMLERGRPGASIVLLGLPYGRRQARLERIAEQDMTIVGSAGSTAENFEEAIALLPLLDLRAFTSKVLPLEDFEGAWQMSTSQEHLKVLLEIDPSIGSALDGRSEL